MKRIVILGAGESGTGAAIITKKKGFDVFVSDHGTISDTYRALLDQNSIQWEDGKHSESAILNADEVIKSPGIPLTAPIVQKLIAQGTPILSEIEFAARYTNAKMICITGSNGKTIVNIERSFLNSNGAEKHIVAAPAAPEIKVGIAAPDVTHGWVAGVAYYAEKYCQDNGLEYKVHTSADAAEMQAGLQDLVAWGATVIVSFPQWAGMETAMQEIIDMGIPVVNFDVDVACEGIYKVTGDNYDMGYQSAKYIVEKAGPAAYIAVLDVPSSGSVCELRKQGFYDYLNEIGYDQSNIQEFQLESFARDDGLKNAADILEKMPQVDAFYSMDDETSIGTIQAMNDAGRTEIKAITGGGGCQEYFQIIASEEGKAPAKKNNYFGGDSFRWYVIQAFSGFEQKVAESIKLQIELQGMQDYFEDVLVPKEKVKEYRDGKKHESERKFFPGYVLIKMEMTEKSWLLVRHTVKVLGFVGGTLNKPVPISDAEAQVILDKLKQTEASPTQKTKFEIGEVVRAKDGAFKDFTGTVEAVDYEKNRLKVSIAIFGRATPVELEFSQVEKDS